MATQQNRQQGTKGKQAAQNEMSNEDGLKLYVAGREGGRRIKLHDQQQQKGRSAQEAVVRTAAGLPDMRFAENQNLFKRDTSKKIDGTEDRRFVENRPDLLAVHAKRGETKPNLIFTDDMLPEGAQDIEVAEAAQ